VYGMLPAAAYLVVSSICEMKVLNGLLGSIGLLNALLLVCKVCSVM
jgi:hypothetical protein